MNRIYKLLSVRLMLALAAALSFAACESIFDGEGNCEVNYNLRFRYDMNLKWADAFPSEVHSVHLYAFDSDGIFVKDFIANGAAVDIEGYTMKLDLDPGKYTLVAWCGMDNEGATEQSFTVPAPVAGQTRIEELTCSLNTKPDSRAEVFSDEKLRFLYHGMLEVELPDVYNGNFDYLMYLTKDTNHIQIVLQQTSESDMESKDFSFKIVDANGKMAYDNQLLASDVITYRPWDVRPVEAEVGNDIESGRGLVQVPGVMADLSTGRLMADHKNDLMLIVKYKEETVFQVPLLQYALLGLEYYRTEYDSTLTPQDFLDRSDEFFFTFFLDKNLKWQSVRINILSWRTVEYNYGFDN